jgi:hypothetical protein
MVTTFDMQPSTKVTINMKPSTKVTTNVNTNMNLSTEVTTNMKLSTKVTNKFEIDLVAVSVETVEEECNDTYNEMLDNITWENHEKRR